MEKENLKGFDAHEYRPIIRPQTEELLVELIKKYRPKHVLEIGTFLGYSAGLMCEVDENMHITTLEKDEQNVRDAKENLKRFGERVEVICCDAFDFLKNTDKQFDFIFLDGPKGQYVNYLPYLKKLLETGGVLMADDVLFYGMVSSDGFVKHKHRSIVEHLRTFLQNLQSDPDFKTQIFDFEDGVSVSVKIK